MGGLPNNLVEGDQDAFLLGAGEADTFGGPFTIDEASFVTPELIRTFCIVGQTDKIIERLHELEAEGLNAINVSFPLERQYRMIEDLSTRVIHRM